MTRWLPLTLSILALLIGASYFYKSAVFSSRSGDDAPLYSTLRHDPYGTAALLDLLNERGIPTHTLEQPNFDLIDNGVLIQVLAVPRFASGSVLSLQTRPLADWIARGNTVIQLTHEPTELMSYFKLPVDDSATQPDLEKFQTDETLGEDPDKLPGSPMVASIRGMRSLANPRLSLRSPMTFKKTDDKSWTPLARLTSIGHAVVAGEYRVGRGKLIVIGAPTPALNQGLGEQGNLDFLLAIIGQRPVFIDEWSHGIGHADTVIGFLYKVGLIPILAQIIFVAMLYAWSTSGYRWPANDTPPRRRSSSEQITTLGFLYGKSLTPDLATERVGSEVQHRLTTTLRCTWPQLPARMAALEAPLRMRMEALLSRLTAMEASRNVYCPVCRYDLRLNQTGRCPECGAVITPALIQKIADAPQTSATETPRSSHVDRSLIELLTESHALSQEIQHERRAHRRTA